ncbi:S24 family peptidase [Cupriavidus sp. H18C2]|uniref:S24 family peptidase n=1 Tax=Cupriavidus sp. H18C2 TaxID=3241602 RepID=UPI003BF7DA03
MQTINEIRKENLRLLMTAHALNASGIARWLEVTPQSVSQVLTGTRNIGDRLARKIEKQFGKAEGWLDREHSLYGDAPELLIASKPRSEPNEPAQSVPPEFLLIPQLSLTPGKGELQQPWHVDESAPREAIRRSWAERRGLLRTSLASFTAEGSGMFPRIADGDTLVVDLQDTQVSSGKIYALMIGDELTVKRLFHIPGGGLRVAADHTDKTRFPDWDLTAEQTAAVQIVGRVAIVIGIV